MDNFDIRELSIHEDGKDIYGMAYVPHGADDGRRFPVIIYAHGMGSNHENGDGYAREFAKRGYFVYCFDFCGGADSKSSGTPEEMTIFTEQHDMETVYEAIVKQPFADANNVFFMGASMGGAVAALAAVRKAGLVKGLILLYPAFNLGEEVTRLAPSIDKLPESHELDVTVYHPFLETLYGFDFYNVIGQYQGPALILHGTNDNVVASGYSVKAVRTYPHANLELIGNGGHGFSGGIFKYAVKVIVNFLDEETDLADESGLEGDLNVPSGMGAFGGMGL